MAENQFLYEQVDTLQKLGGMNGTEVPKYILDNLKYEARPYQTEAFRRFMWFMDTQFEGKQEAPYDITFNMATGNGKTMMMAGLMIELWKRGYRNFVFFVNSTNILEKTKDNFVDNTTNKYLYKDRITADGKEVKIKAVDNLDEADDENINIVFTTIQKLYSDMTNVKENSVNYETFEGKDIVLIADEAHHLNSETKKKETEREIYESWESVVVKILEMNIKNILLEFSATIDYQDAYISNKYRDKVLYRYDLKHFREDGYSKDIFLFRSDKTQKERILQAMIMNQYRGEIANRYGINLKPVMLLKSKTIRESLENKGAFHEQVENLTGREIEDVRRKGEVDVLTRAFEYFDCVGLSSADTAARIKRSFREENTLSTNNDKDVEENQRRLNTLEDGRNPVRAIFAVDKLNEGWDVLNLYDIVRLYETRDGKNGKPGKTTMQEAQLIGRGARLYPFALEDNHDKFRRKYDSDITNDLRILEQLYYHSQNESRYISELTKALTETGIYDGDDKTERELKLKDGFKKTNLFLNGKVFFNQLKDKDRSKITKLSQLDVSGSTKDYRLSGNDQSVTFVYGDEVKSDPIKPKEHKSKDIGILDFPMNVLYYGLHDNDFFRFSNLKKRMPNLGGLKEFIGSPNYLGGYSIRFTGTEEQLNSIRNVEYLEAFGMLLKKIEDEIKANDVQKEGGKFTYDVFHKIFKDKTLNLNKNDERATSQKDFNNHIDLSSRKWYAYNDNWGTSEEKKFVELFEARFDALEKDFEDIYLVRNEREIAVYDRRGRRFEPDFLLFCKEKGKEPVTYQIFIEPKGDHLMQADKWKEDFLKEIKVLFKGELAPLDFETDRYIVTGIPFYNTKKEQGFAEALEKELK